MSDHFLVTCEHGGNRIPSSYQPLFTASQALLDTHRGYDLGALMMAKEMAAVLGARLVSSTISRLLVDLNRSVGHPTLYSEATRNVTEQLRERILKYYYRPYRAKAEEYVRLIASDHGRVIHISSHSFTPVLNARERNADIGLLYDPARAPEVAFSRSWQLSIKACAPQFRVRRNYPYAGKGDGLTSYLRRRFPPERYVGIELEINQKFPAQGGRHWAAMRKAVIESLQLTLQRLHKQLN